MRKKKDISTQSALRSRWFPERPDRKIVGPRLAEFYKKSDAYHEMTGTEGKENHPQVRILSCLLKPGEEYAEIGCGSGTVCRAVARTASVIGFDVSPIAVRNAEETCRGLNARFVRASGENLPLADGSVAGTYSFEALEHVWDPVAVAREMARVTRPGGFVLISAPCRFSLDLHLTKRMTARVADFAFAGTRYLLDFCANRSYANVCPDLDGQVYPDCDMIAAISPGNFAKAIESMGCGIEFWDTTYMCAHREGSATTLEFQKNTARPFVRHFGDHVLILARKTRSRPAEERCA